MTDDSDKRIEALLKMVSDAVGEEVLNAFGEDASIGVTYGERNFTIVKENGKWVESTDEN